VVASTLGVILGVVRQAGWISLIFSLEFALALLLEIAGGWQETTRSYRRRLLQAFSFVLGVIVLAAVAYREGWEAVLLGRRVISSHRFPPPWTVVEENNGCFNRERSRRALAGVCLFRGRAGTPSGALPRVPASAEYVGKGRAFPKGTGGGPPPRVAEKEEQAFEASVSI
jgi:hypothetical protein